MDAHQPQKYNREQWRTNLVNAIENNHFIFQWQPILSWNAQEVIQREIYCRLSINEQIVTAREFMPFIELLSLGSQLDKCLLESIVKQNILEVANEGIAINLTNESISDIDFITWLAHFLKTSDYVDRILFELPEAAVISSFESCYQIIDIIRTAGAKVGIDQCGRQIGSLDYLQKLQPDYIKLDQSFAFYEKLNQSKELCRALMNVAKGLNIQVIITGIEDEAQLTNFSSLKADGYQGYISPVEDV